MIATADDEPPHPAPGTRPSSVSDPGFARGPAPTAAAGSVPATAAVTAAGTPADPAPAAVPGPAAQPEPEVAPETAPGPDSGPQTEPMPRLRAWRLFCLDVWFIGRRCHRDSIRIELMHRALGFAALGFVTLVPLLIVIAAAAPLDGHTFPTWVAVGLGLTGNSADAVRNLFGPPGRVLSTTTALSLAVLAVFGLSFATSVQVGFERIWELTPARWYSVWRRVVWLAVLIGYILGSADLVELLHGVWYLSAAQLVLSMASSTAFFWWSARFLLDGRIGWRTLFPGAVLTVLGLVGLRIFSAVLFSPMIISSALTYGAIGTVLVVVSWLIGVGFVIFGGAMCGRALAEARSIPPRLSAARTCTCGAAGAAASEPANTTRPAQDHGH
ncbi:MAG TPA: YhjD/YihY/BrkB family envelope integrity protein [Actinocrinis sp.]|nr:YhjD/YihY/BrkB family envelope integrity protein [Actinocrinis sp.]